MVKKSEPDETGHDPSIHHGAAGMAWKPDLRDIETAADLEQQTNQGAQGGAWALPLELEREERGQPMP